MVAESGDAASEPYRGRRRFGLLAPGFLYSIEEWACGRGRPFETELNI